MIRDFTIVDDVMEDSPHQRWHFKLCLDDKEYEGYYKDGEVDWFQMQPDQEDHGMSLEQLDEEVKRRMAEWVAQNPK